MIDLTIDAKDKDNYIIDVNILDNGTYLVQYATGREEIFPFSLHNFQVELRRMEQQYNQYSKDYLDSNFPNIKLRGKLLLTMIFIDISYVFLMITDKIDILKIFMFIYLLYSLIKRGVPYLSERKKYLEVKKQIEIIKLYLDNKEKFKIEIMNPNSKMIEEWYFVNLANIEQFTSFLDLEKYIDNLTLDKKQSEVEKMTLKLKKV